MIQVTQGGDGVFWVQSPCAQHLKMSEFVVRKGLLVKKVPSEKMGVLILKSILRKYRVQAFLCQGKGEREGLFL